MKNLPIEWIERIFMRLHGRFGNNFLDKYKIGQLNDNGEDVGIINAKNTWALELAGVSTERLKAALSATYNYAPSCDEFLKHCVANEIKDFKAITSVTNYEDNKKSADELIVFIAKELKPKTDYKGWAKRILKDPNNFPQTSVDSARKELGVAYD